MPHETSGREFIVDTAARLFSQKGYAGVSIRDIAQACRLTNAALYYHFKNKEDLYLAALRRHHEQIARRLAETVEPQGDLPARLRQLVRSYAEVMCGQRQSFQTLRRDLAHIDDARARKLLGEMHADFMRPIQQLIEAGQADGQIVAGDARLLARLLHGMIIALTFEGAGRPPRLSAGETQTLVDVFLHGVVKKE
ncbi:MAG TPA: TetR/AcrR family transcriptional regulator [Anaerolineae bacterium]|nr:TetR/AcrR family transcriptional regulator [Anaerolineae bacterium]